MYYIILLHNILCNIINVDTYFNFILLITEVAASTLLVFGYLQLILVYCT